MQYESEYSDYDVAVIGHGISGLATALAAQEAGVSAVVLEKSPKSKRGGHSRYAGGTFRFPMEDTAEVKERFDLEEEPGQYTRQDFFEDLFRLSEGRTNPDLIDVLIENAYETVQWLSDNGVDFTTKHRVDGRDEINPLKTKGRGERLQVVGEAVAAIDTLADRIEELGADFHYRTAMNGLLTDERNHVVGVEARTPNGTVKYETDAVAICAGSYVSDTEKRTRYYGREGDNYVVRGSEYNTGEALEAALDAGARAEGQWGGAHQVLLDERAPPTEGGRTRINGYQYGVILNERGERFVDEGEDLLSKTYAKLGKHVIDQPNQRAFVVYGSDVAEYVSSQMGTDPIEATSLERVLQQAGVRDVENAVETVEAFNASLADGEFDPTQLDGKHTEGLRPKKSNWAVPIAEPPFYCFPGRAGITFGFGGLKINTEAEVIDSMGNAIPGLWAVGNSTSDFFYNNYPAGSALMRGAVYGRIAGRNAATHVG